MKARDRGCGQCNMKAQRLALHPRGTLERHRRDATRNVRFCGAYDQCGHRAYTYQSTSGGAVDFGVRRRYLAIRRLRLATVSGISGANGAVAEWLKAAVC